jgi:hypothetical protein
MGVAVRAEGEGLALGALRVPCECDCIDVSLCEQTVPWALPLSLFSYPSPIPTEREEEELKVVEGALELLVKLDGTVLCGK